MEKLKQAERQLKTEMRLYRRKTTIKQNNAPRDAMIIAIARESGLPSRNKQADYICDNWDDTDLAQFTPLSSDRIRVSLN
jgi:hypothetical protein